MNILSIDPSGNFSEGKGKTGYAIYDGDLFKFGTVDAKHYKTRVEYWFAVAALIVMIKPDLLIIEDYRLYNTAATGAHVQSFSQLETPRLLGVLETTAAHNNIPVVFQMANVTTPYDDIKLTKLGVIKKEKNRWWFIGRTAQVAVNDHERSALRHLLRYLDRERIKWMN